MSLTIKTSSICVQSHHTLLTLPGELEKLFHPLDLWCDQELESVIGVMHSLTFPKEGSLCKADDVNKQLVAFYQARGWSVIGGDTSAGTHLVLSISLIGHQRQNIVSQIL